MLEITDLTTIAGFFPAIVAKNGNAGRMARCQRSSWRPLYARYFANELSAEGMDKDRIWAMLKEMLDHYLQNNTSAS